MRDNPYPIRWHAVCACGWFMSAYDLHVMNGAADRHPEFRRIAGESGHVAYVCTAR